MFDKTNFINEYKVAELFEKLYKQHPKDYDTLREIESIVFPMKARR